MTASRSILLVSPDLLIGSRLAGLAGGCSMSLDTVTGVSATPRQAAYDLVLLDLQGDAAPAADLVAAARRLAGGPDARVVAFGPHVARERLDAARVAGADDVLSRGELLGGFPALLRRWSGADA